MSQTNSSNVFTTRPGALDGLELGAPLTGGHSTSNNDHGLISSHQIGGSHQHQSVGDNVRSHAQSAGPATTHQHSSTGDYNNSGNYNNSGDYNNSGNYTSSNSNPIHASERGHASTTHGEGLHGQGLVGRVEGTPAHDLTGQHNRVVDPYSSDRSGGARLPSTGHALSGGNRYDHDGADCRDVLHSHHRDHNVSTCRDDSHGHSRSSNQYDHEGADCRDVLHSHHRDHNVSTCRDDSHGHSRSHSNTPIADKFSSSTTSGAPYAGQTGDRNYSGAGVGAGVGAGALAAGALSSSHGQHTGPSSHSSTGLHSSSGHTGPIGGGSGGPGNGLHTVQEKHIVVPGNLGSSQHGDGLSHGSTHTHGSGVGAGAGAGLAAVGAGGAYAASKHTGSGSGLTGSHGTGTGQHHGSGTESITEKLKHELKLNQSGDDDLSRSSSNSSTHHKLPESKGPHGLVMQDGKYVHRRSIDLKGSTGVPLKKEIFEGNTGVGSGRRASQSSTGRASGEFSRRSVDGDRRELSGLTGTGSGTGHGVGHATGDARRYDTGDRRL